ncbi:MAG: class I SAM-dependent methyltransferase, partial [Chloroflexi bacterium]|nr:class I SAM-dependent methyltransferase [Chloroflexota bacterium]
MTAASEPRLPGLSIATACRACGGSDLRHVLSLGQTPLANSLLPLDSADDPLLYPLDLVRCGSCFLVQLQQIVDPATLFSDYVYFSSFSDAMLRHADEVAAELTESRGLDGRSLAVEIASNDGYLLKFFQQRGVPVLGVEPAQNIARVANEAGIPTIAEFFDSDLARRLAGEGRCADVVIGNNVLAHVPDLNGFLDGVRQLLRPDGVAIFEVPYLKDMLDNLEFDTIYHEHGCYFSLSALDTLFRRHDLSIKDVRRLPIHGGSLQLHVAPSGCAISPRVNNLGWEEVEWDVGGDTVYEQFARSVGELKAHLLELLDQLKSQGRRIAAYGAAAKGVTLTSYCGIDGRYLDFVVDRSPHKQGLLFPVGKLPIDAPDRLVTERPDYALLLTWNFAAEIMEQQRAYREAGGRFI